MLKRLIARLDDFLYRVILKNLLQLSKLGHGCIVEGAESGVNFEHMYNNIPEGKLVIGKIIDKILLGLKACQATRIRKDEIKSILWNEVRNNMLQNRKTKVLDLASGGARYLRELKEEHNAGQMESICIDKDLNCVSLGRELSEKEGVLNIRFFRGDLFKLAFLKRFGSKKKWRPNVIIASGLLIYFNDETSENILKEIYKALADDGIVIFQSYENLDTKKLMRKTLATSTGQSWTLYYRKPVFWRNLLWEIGFRNIFITRDQWHMNNVCSGRTGRL